MWTIYAIGDGTNAADGNLSRREWSDVIIIDHDDDGNLGDVEHDADVDKFEDDEDDAENLTGRDSEYCWETEITLPFLWSPVG